MDEKEKRTVLGQFMVNLPPDVREGDISSALKVTGPKGTKTGDEHAPDIGVDVDIDF